MKKIIETRYNFTVILSIFLIIIHVSIFYMGLNYQLVQIVTFFTMGITAAFLTALTFEKVVSGLLYGYSYMFVICFLILVAIPAILDPQHDIMHLLTDEDEGIGWSLAYLMMNSITYIPIFIILRFIKRSLYKENDINEEK